MTSSTQHRPVLPGQQRVAVHDLAVHDLAVPDLAVLRDDELERPVDVFRASPPTVPLRRPTLEPTAPKRDSSDTDTDADADADAPEPEPEPPAPEAHRTAPIKRDRAALRARSRPAGPTSSRTSDPATAGLEAQAPVADVAPVRARTRPALRGRAPMPYRAVTRDRARLRGRSAAPAVIRHQTEPATPRRRRRYRSSLAVVLILIGTTALWSGYQVRSAQSSLAAARAETGAVQRQLVTYQWAAAGAGLTRARLHTQDAADVTGSRPWRLAGHLPWVGDDAAAIGRTADSLDDVMRSARPLEAALPRLATSSEDGPDVQAGGRVDVAALQTVTATLPSIDAALTRSADSLRGTTSTGLTGSAAADLDQTRRLVDSLGSTAGPAAPTLRLLPGMLGAQGVRTWLVLLRQADAAGQPHSARVGAYAVVRVENGSVSVLTARRRPRLPAGTGRTVTAQAAALAGVMRDRAAGPPDYTVVLDGPALAALVQATGPIRVGTSTIDGANSQRYLQQDIFGRWRAPAQTDYIAAQVLRRSLSRLASGGVDRAQLLRSLSAPVHSRQLQLWSGRPDVQAQLIGLSVAAGPDAGEATRIARLVTALGG